MHKIIVVGATGSGKSTLAKALAEKIQIENIQLDLLFWKPNWQWSSDEEFFPKIEAALKDKERWVVDGNYSRTYDILWPKADTVIWIDFPFWLTFYQNFSRSIKRIITREELWPNTNNRESFTRLIGKESILRWLWKTYPLMQQRYEKRFADPEHDYINFYRLRSRAEVKQFINSL